ncbi:MAG: Rpn family recombination-promoting nuclease/putative transposase [Bacteroidales bacterium]|nr:Rpn family recombination-promoting nuclease/putative transposase [Bacteroidales bacterium]
MKYYDPRADILFKKIFGRNEDLTISFLNAMLPLEGDSLVKTIKYLQPEVLPIIPDLKDSIVDVLCVDVKGRTFVVEMQMFWTSYFKQRILFNAAKMYVTQIERGENYDALIPVYGLNLVNDIFDVTSEDYYHRYTMCEPSNPDKTIDGIELFFFELPKFKPKTFSDKRMQVLWLKFLTEINEKTIDVDPELLENPEISKALDICTYLTQEELLGYDRYWDAISTAKTLASGKYKDGLDAGLEKGEKIGLEKGLEKGLVQGRAEGEKQKAFAIARAMKNHGDDIDYIAMVTGLSAEEIEKL